MNIHAIGWTLPDLRLDTQKHPYRLISRSGKTVAHFSNAKVAARSAGFKTGSSVIGPDKDPVTGHEVMVGAPFLKGEVFLSWADCVAMTRDQRVDRSTLGL